MYLRMNSLGRQNFVAHIYETRNKTKISQWKVFLEVSRLIQVKKRERERERKRKLMVFYRQNIWSLFLKYFQDLFWDSPLISEESRKLLYRVTCSLVNF